MNQVHVAEAFPAQNLNTFKPHKAGNNGTLIAVILDESGSMESCRSATIAGFNEFVQGQRAATHAGEAYLTLVKFHAPQITRVYENVHVSAVPELSTENYRPCGGTNLMDAIGQTLGRINDTLSAHKAEHRPSVMVVIITDGAENASREFHTQQIKAMVKACEEAEFLFTFLGANVDAFTMGNTFGMNTANTINYSTANMAATMDVLSKATVGVRAAKMAGASTAEIYSHSLYSHVDRDRTMGR